MKIVIAGAGEVGTHLAKMLSGGKHDITVIDLDPKLLEEVGSMADVITILGDATTFAVLKRAAIRKTDLYIAVAHDESVNIISAILAKQLGARKSIARIDNSEYLEPTNKEMFIKMGVDYLFHPELITAREVVDLLGHTSSSEYVDLSGGRLALCAYKLDEMSPLTGKTLAEATAEHNHLNFRIVAIMRGNTTIIPRGNDTFNEDDSIYIITDKHSERRVMELSGKKSISVKKMMILGGSRIGVHIAMELQNEMDIKLIEYNQDKAYKIAEQLSNTLILHEDGRNIDSMMQEGLSNMDAFVAVTGRSETNILAAMLAKKLGVKKVIAEVENINYINLAESIGIDTIVNKKIITASTIFRFTTTTDVHNSKYLAESDTQVLEFIVKPGSPATKRQIKDLDIPADAIIGGVVRGEVVFIAVGDSQIEAYDRIVVFALPSAIEKIGQFFNRN